MQIFITGTDTDVGKTTISGWLCLHSGYDYFKPIQTGVDRDSSVVQALSGAVIHPEAYLYQTPVSPHLAAALEGEIIDITQITLPPAPNLIIEGAGGLLVPINKEAFMIDLIKQMNVPVLLVARSALGAINHTLLSLEALRSRGIHVLGVIVSGKLNQDNCAAIEFYGKTKVLAQVPFMDKIDKETLLSIPLGDELNKILGSK